MGGALTVGTEDEPFLQRAVITLHGSPVSKGYRCTAPPSSAAVVHARPPRQAHRARVDLSRGDGGGGRYRARARLPVHDWAPDGAAPVMVMVTSTAANGTMEEAETCVLLGVDGTGTRLTLSAPLLATTSAKLSRSTEGTPSRSAQTSRCSRATWWCRGRSRWRRSTSTAATSCCTRARTARSPTAPRASRSSGGSRTSRCGTRGRRGASGATRSTST